MDGASGGDGVGENSHDREAGMDVGTRSGRGSATGREVGSASASASPTPRPEEGHVNDGNINNVWNLAARIGTQRLHMSLLLIDEERWRCNPTEGASGWNRR